MEKEMERLRKELAAMKKENLALQNKNQLLIQKTSSSSSQIRHSQEFWADIQSNLKSDTDSIKALIKNGTITMNDTDPSFGNTLLHSAAFFGNYEITQLCINLGADLFKKRNDGKTALDLARKGKQAHIEQILLMNEMNANIGDRINNLSKNINGQNGVIQCILNELTEIGDQSKELFVKILNEIMINTINKKHIFCDNILNLCWELEKEENSNILESELWRAISKTCKDIIENGSKTDWFWIKNYLIKSNIWYQEIDEMAEEKTDNIDNKIKRKQYLYYKLLSMVEKESKKQLIELGQNLEFDATQNKAAWNELVNFEIAENKLCRLQERDGIKARIPRHTLV